MAKKKPKSKPRPRKTPKPKGPLRDKEGRTVTKKDGKVQRGTWW